MKLSFITGFPRSGSSWFTNIFSKAEGVLSLSESRFVFNDDTRREFNSSLYEVIEENLHKWYFYIAHRKRNWLQTDEIITTFNKINHIYRDKYDKRYDEDAIGATKAVILYFVEKACKNKNAEFAVDKSPIIKSGQLEILLRMFPESKIIFLKRNLKNWLVSLSFLLCERMKDGEINKHFFMNAEEDYVNMEKFLNNETNLVLTTDRAIKLTKIYNLISKEAELFSKKYNNFRIISYEEMFDNPINVAADVFKFFEIPVNKKDLVIKDRTIKIREIKRKNGEIILLDGRDHSKFLEGICLD